MRHTGGLRAAVAANALPSIAAPAMSSANPFLPGSIAAPPATTTYANTEYALDLPTNWKVLPTDTDNSVTFQSEADRAALFITVDFYEIPADKARATAERLIEARLAQLETQAPGQVDMFDSGVQPHWRGQGVEMYYAAHVAKRDVVMYFVYVMPRRVVNFTLVSKQDRQQAMALLRAVHSHFRPTLA